jgi:hypothetical protein
VILQITGVDDMPMISDDTDHPMTGSNPIVLTLDDNNESLERFMTQSNVYLDDEV